MQIEKVLDSGIKLGAFVATLYALINFALKPLKKDLKAQKKDISGLKSDVSGLKADVIGLKADVSGLKYWMVAGNVAVVLLVTLAVSLLNRTRP